MVNNKANKIAKYAIMFATIFVAIMLDRVISLGLPTATAAVVLLVTFSFCYLDNTWASGIVAATLFGLASFFKEFIFPSSVATFPVYMWPIITVLPRVAMGAVAFSVYRLMLKFTKKIKSKYTRQTVSMSVATFFGLLTNTVLFLSTLNICKILFGKDYTSLILVIKGVLITNIIPEYLISMLLVPHVVLGVRRGLKLGMEANASQKMADDTVTTTPIEKSDAVFCDNDNAKVICVGQPNDIATNARSKECNELKQNDLQSTSKDKTR